MTENILLQDCALVTAKISIVHSGGGKGTFLFVYHLLSQPLSLTLVQYEWGDLFH